ncbi:phospholipase A [Endozoicomonas lisbonensis]|uniref:Phospholipase A1 n=1 Tax=Endozoicomonas lisbonensis TaxID=3120522 RepID=A0ABV2SDE7_9GAMM
MMRNLCRGLFAFACIFPVHGFSDTHRKEAESAYEQCLMKEVKNGDDQVTLHEIRRRCEHFKPEHFSEPILSDTGEHDEQLDDEHGVITDRILSEESVEDNRFVITPHRPNYLLPFSYNASPNREPFGNLGDKLSRYEVKFQISLKAPLWKGVFRGYGDLFVAYTNVSWWQAYNSLSSPFRETNHEPEAFFVFPTDFDFLGLRLRALSAGINHQSNGRTGSISRSWNRIRFGAYFERGSFYLALSPWYRIPEKSKDIHDSNYPNVKGDDNPGIERYMGYGELLFGYKFNRHNVGVILRNNLRSDNLGAIQLDWSFPLTERFRGYVQYFNGYGESLIDYNKSTNRISLGVMLTDWL